MKTFINITRLGWAGVIISTLIANFTTDVGLTGFFFAVSVWAAAKIFMEAVIALHGLTHTTVQTPHPQPEPSEESLTWIKHNTFDNW